MLVHTCLSFLSSCIFLVSFSGSTAPEGIYIDENFPQQFLSAESNSSTESAVQVSAAGLIQTQPISRPHTKKMIDTNVTVDDDSFLKHPVKTITVPLHQALRFCYDLINCNINTIT